MQALIHPGPGDMLYSTTKKIFICKEIKVLDCSGLSTCESHNVTTVLVPNTQGALCLVHTVIPHNAKQTLPETRRFGSEISLFSGLL